MDPKLLLEEKEQALLASQETVQVRRILTNYKPGMRSYWENLKLRPCRMDQAIVRSIQQGLLLRFFIKTERWRLKSSFIILWYLPNVFTGP